MRKKIIIIIAVFTFITLILLVPLLMFSNKKSNTDNPKSDTDIIHVAVDKAVEDYKDTAILAIESFAQQNINETTRQRSDRLKKVFTSDSFASEKKLNDINDTVYKTSAKVKKIEHFIDSYEGVHKILIVYAKLTCYHSGGIYEIDKTYWLSLAEQEDGSYIPNDAGEYFK